MKISRFFPAFLVALTAVAIPPTAQGWAVLSYVEGRRSEGYLLRNVFNGTEIKYVLRIEDAARFPYENIQAQVEVALKIWLKPFEDLGFPAPKISRVDSSASNVNLVVEITGGKHTQTADMNIFASRHQIKPFSKIIIRTNYLVRSEFQPAHSFPVKDFSGFLPRAKSLTDDLYQLSTKGEFDVFSFSDKYQMDWRLIWNSTYPTIMHELGHAFGLADTCKGQLQIQSKPTERSATQPDSIMKSSNHFAPQKDDLQGIKAVVLKHTRLHTFEARKTWGSENAEAKAWAQANLE